RVETLEVERRCGTRKVEHIVLSFPRKRQRPCGCRPCSPASPQQARAAREPAPGSRSVGALVNQPRQHRRGDRHTGRRAESEWALLEGFCASPSLNESNP
ncbi:Hypothetical protein SMAX5B_005671, partial [Scophthalmus maximus]